MTGNEERSHLTINRDLEERKLFREAYVQSLKNMPSVSSKVHEEEASEAVRSARHFFRSSGY